MIKKLFKNRRKELLDKIDLLNQNQIILNNNIDTLNRNINALNADVVKTNEKLNKWM